MTGHTSKKAKYYAPLIHRDGVRTLETNAKTSLAALLKQAQRAANPAGNKPQAAIVRQSPDMAYFHGQQLKVVELTHPPHALMLHALLNALPIADVSGQPNVINDTSTRADFENVCPVRFLALFPMGKNAAGYLVLYDVNPTVLQPAAFAELCALAETAGQSFNKCE